MRRPFWTRVLALMLAVLLTGCVGADPAAPTTEETGSNSDTQHEHTFEQTVIPPTFEAEGYTLFVCTTCDYSYEDNFTAKLELTEKQKNALAWLNYLTAITYEVNNAYTNRLYLEEIYDSLFNNTNPEVDSKINKQLNKISDTIHRYRILETKRDRIEYLYNQNKALAIQQAVSNPSSLLENIDLGAILNFVGASPKAALAASAATIALSSISSIYANANEFEQKYLTDGWELDDALFEELHNSRKDLLNFVNEVVNTENLPGHLTLSENAVEEFVDKMATGNAHSRLQFLESHEDTYRAFGSYWLALAECYYELQKYEACLNSVAQYEKVQANIFRKDYKLAQIMPLAIVSAEEVYATPEYIAQAERFLNILTKNIDTKQWDLRYFAAQTYIDLHAKTEDVSYLDTAYNLVLDNVNHLADVQRKLVSTYLADVQEIPVPDGATKEETQNIKEYNKFIKEARKTELPVVYEPFLLNCELIYALADKLNKSSGEREKIDAILSLGSSDVFLTDPVINRFLTTPANTDITASFDKTSLTIPVSCVSVSSVIRVNVMDSGSTTIYEDWTVKSVTRPKSEDNKYNFEEFTVTYVSESAKSQKWSANSTVRVDIYDEADSEHASIVIWFKVSKYTNLFFEFVEFEQVR